MSRTDRDRPYRVRSADPHEPREAVHNHSPNSYHRSQGAPAERECDLPDYHDRTPEPATHRRWTWYGTHCYWRLTYWTFSPYGGPPPKWYRDTRWHNPERVRERVQLGDAAKRWNAGDDLEDFDFACWGTHREGGYWD